MCVDALSEVLNIGPLSLSLLPNNVRSQASAIRALESPFAFGELEQEY